MGGTSGNFSFVRRRGLSGRRESSSRDARGLVEITRDLTTGGFIAWLRNPGSDHSHLLPTFAGETEDEARAQMHALLDCKLASDLIAKRILPDEPATRALAASMAFLTQNGRTARTVTDSELTSAALALAPKAQSLRSAIRRVESTTPDSLGVLLHGVCAKAEFIAALNRLSVSKATLRKLTMFAPKKRGPIARGSHAAWLLECLAGTWEQIYGSPPRPTARFTGTAEVVMRTVRQSIPVKFADWVERELTKLTRSVNA